MASGAAPQEVASLRLRGRDAELRRLVGVVQEARCGSGRVVLVSGDAGIGKSRLAAEVVVCARDAGFVILRGGAHALHAGLAYAPLAEAIGPYLSGLDLARRHELLAGLDDLGRLFPELHLPAPGQLGDPALERTRLFEVVARLMAGIAARTPVLLFIDDLHWADPATVEMVHYLARGVAGRRVLLLVTYRGSEPASGTPLGDFVVSMRRSETAVEVALDPLTGAAVLDLLRDLLSTEPPARLVDAVVNRAAGVPLFVTALIGQLLESGALSRGPEGLKLSSPDVERLPIIVRDVVLARLRGLGPGERRLLELIAVAGEAATPDLLEDLWRGDAGELVEPLRRLVSDRLLVEQERSGALRFEVAHPLYAEVAYAEITAWDRRRLHAEVAQALERLRPDDVIALAPHYRYAADVLDPERTLEILAAAGRRALDLHADSEASRYLQAASRLAERLRDHAMLLRLSEALGEAHQRCGALESAAAAWRNGILTAQQEGDARTEGMLHHRLALLEWDRGDTARAMEHVAAGQAVDPAPDEQALEQLCIRVMLLSRRWGAAVQREAATEIAAFAERYPASPMVKLSTHMVGAYTAFHDGDLVAARREAERLLSLAEKTGVAMALGAALRLLALAATTAGDLDLGRDHASRLITVTHQLGTPTLECSSRATLAGIHYLAGDWGRALAEADTALALARRSAAGRAMTGALALRTKLLAGRGELAEARTCLAEARRAYEAGVRGDRTMAVSIAAAQAAIACVSGDRADACEVPDDLPINTALPVPIQHSLLAQGRLTIGDAEGALSVARHLRTIGRGDAPLPNAVADRLEGRVAGMCGDTDSATRLLKAATDQLESLGAPVEAAMARLDWCEIVAAADPQSAAAGAAMCLAEFERVGARPFADRTRRLLRTLGVRTPARAATGELSDREREVALLVAEGLSNAEIAARLFLSVRTVETHLHHVYARLGLDSRVALAQWVSRHDRRAPAT